MKRLTSKRDGVWVVATKPGTYRRVGANPVYLFFRVVDRVLVGKPKRGNHW